MTMTRTVLFAAILALGTAAAVLPATPAHAQEKKSIFSFFNRQGDDGRDNGGPIHMSPGTQDAAKDSGTKAYGFGNRQNKKTARYEDSPLNAERQRQATSFAQWNANDLAAANASTTALIEQMKAEQTYNAQVARQQQAEKIAQAGQKMSAGSAPGNADPSVVQAMRDGARQQAINSMQGVTGTAPPPARTPQATPAPETPAPDKAKREPRSQTLFNRLAE